MLTVDDERALKILLRYRRRVESLADRIELNAAAGNDCMEDINLCDYGQEQIAPVVRAVIALLLDGEVEDFRRLIGDRVLYLSGSGV